ncbi:MAG: energy-coupling factor ABC transporter permease [bacterium]
MHAPDGFYSDSLCLVMDLACAGVLTYSLKKIWRQINTPEVLLASSVGAFCFALEMANFEVTRGSSCHFMGGIFASIVLGPYLATLVMTLAHFIQVFIFQDGGIMALGPNLVTIVVVSTFGGYYLYFQLKNLVIEPYGYYISAFLSAWLTLLITSLTVCGMLSVCGIEKFSATISPMLGPHVVVGITEGVLTVLLIMGIQALSAGHPPDPQETAPRSTRKVAWALLGMALLVSLVISPFASRSAEGLKVFALNRIYLRSHKIVIPYQAPVPNYHLPGVRNQKMAKILGGTLGTLLTFFFCFLVCSAIREKAGHTAGKEPADLELHYRQHDQDWQDGQIRPDRQHT